MFSFLASLGIKAVISAVLQKLIKMYLNPDFLIRIGLCWFGKFAKGTKTQIDDMFYNQGVREMKKQGVDIPCKEIALGGKDGK